MTNEERIAKLEANHETNSNKITELEKRVNDLTQKDNDIIIKENQKLNTLEKNIIQHFDETSSNQMKEIKEYFKIEIDEMKLEIGDIKMENKIMKNDIFELKNKPKDQAYKRQTWVIATLLSLLVGLVGALISKMIN